MLKLEIKMDENKILDEQKYKVESIYQARIWRKKNMKIAD